MSKAGLHRIVEQLVAEHGRDGVNFYNLQPGVVATERVLGAGAKLAALAAVAAPVEVVGTAMARILDTPAGTFKNGANIQVQDVARLWGLISP